MKKRKQAVKKMVAENNELRKQLTKENRDYYENLLTYLRGKSFLLSSRAKLVNYFAGLN